MRSPSILATGLMVLPALAPAGPMHQGEWHALHERLEVIAEDVVGTSATGMTIAVVDAHGRQLLDAWGHADAARTVDLTPDSRMPVASVSKVVTALTALTLDADGILDLDAPVANLAGIEVRDERPHEDRTPITGRHLLTHHAGLSESILLYPPAADSDLARPLADWLDQHPPTLRYPAIGLHYSPLAAYTVIGATIEQATGSPFDVAAREAVLAPAGVRDATFDVADREEGDAEIVRRDAGGFAPVSWPVTPETPAASLRWSARDAAAVLSSLLDDDGGLHPAVVEAALEVTVRPRHGGGGHTQVFFEEERGGVRVLEHAGGNGVAWLTVIPEAGVGAFVAVNSEERAAVEATEAAVDALVTWAVETGRAHEEPDTARRALEPDWLAEAASTTPSGVFHERLFSDQGPEKALRILLGQVVVAADGDDLVMNGRRLVPREPGRWCDDEGCIAGVRSPSGLVLLERGDRGMLEQTLVRADWWDDRRVVLPALAAGTVTMIVALGGAVRRSVRRLRRRPLPPSIAPGIATAWALTAGASLTGTLVLPLWPMLTGTSVTVSPDGIGLWTLSAITATSALLGLAWLVRAVRRRTTVGRSRQLLTAVAVAAAVPLQLYLLDWGIHLV